MVMSDSKHQVTEEEGDVDEEAGVEEEDVVVGEDKSAIQLNILNEVIEITELHSVICLNRDKLSGLNETLLA